MATDFEVAQSRSPRYPRYPLQAAIAYAKRLYDGAHRSLVDTNTAYKVMGFAGKTGASATALGAVRQYGLIEAQRGGIRISSLGLQILEPANPDEYNEAIHEAANQPSVFAQLSAHFEGEFPRSDEPIRAYLIRQLGFSKKGADECISSLRETFSYAESYSPVGQSNADTAEEKQVVASPVGLAEERDTAIALSAATQSANPSTDLMVVPLTKDCRVEMRFYGEITDRALAKLTRYIELMQEDWTEQ